MALGDMMVSRYAQSSGSALSSHLDGCVNRDTGERNARPSETVNNSYNGDTIVVGVGNNAIAPTSIAYLPQTVVLTELRHEGFEDYVPTRLADTGFISKWRPCERMKTGCVALVLCLNISVDPPDVIKIAPCARMECWIDPFSLAPQKALELIGKSLQIQYERWQPRARYKPALDPTIDEVKRLCLACRKTAKGERVLFHYNGHGVPKPTSNGEIWLFNKSYTQYIPLKISDLDSWIRTPSIYVFDCSAAGTIMNSFMQLQDWAASTSSGQTRDCIILAACEAHETLPQSAEFPADIFTSCLTTPLKMALRWFVPRSLLRDTLNNDLIDQIPGRQNDRRTLLGELNWIFTAITDTIAWNVLPHDLFQRLFRQDLLVASLFRNFLLAERIMRSTNCSPVSYPMLPPTHQHHMWDAWDMAAELCLSQLPALVEDPSTELQPSPFFSEQLTAFEVWLDHGSEDKKPPEQLPIVLQVLLSQSHRFRALILLGRFLDMGNWAVNQALSVGIFPYILKLLQTTTPELRQILVFIWTKILALDRSCQTDVVKDNGHMYFINFLDSLDAYPEQRAMAAFALAVIVDGHKIGQQMCIEANLIYICLKHIQGSGQTEAIIEPLLLQWLILCLGKLFEDCIDAHILAFQANTPSILAPMVTQPQPEVRAATVFALGALLDVGFDSIGDKDDDEKLKVELFIVKTILSAVSDGSALVRIEVAVALARFAFRHNQHLKSVASASVTVKQPPLANNGSSSHSDESDTGSVSNGHTRTRELDNAVYLECILAMFSLAKDPSPRISALGKSVLSSIGIEQVVARSNGRSGVGTSDQSVHQSTTNPSTAFAGLARSYSGFDMNAGGNIPLTFRTPPVSPPARPSHVTGIRRVSSLDLRPNLMNIIDSGLADPLVSGSSSERSFLPKSSIYHWSCGHFSKPLLYAPEDADIVVARREEREKLALQLIEECQHASVSKLTNQTASWDTKFETGAKTAILLPFSPVVIASDENERIRVWDYQKASLLNSFDNHNYPEKGISKLCIINELDENLLLVASSDGDMRVWKNFDVKDEQVLVTSFSAIQPPRSGVRNVNAIVDWQQKSSYLYTASEVSPMKIWDLDREQLITTIPSPSDCAITSLAASEIHAYHFTAGFVDGSVKFYDIRTPSMLVAVSRPKTKKLDKIVGLAFHPGLDQGKIISASQGGDIQFVDLRETNNDPYRTIPAHRGSLTAVAIHRHAHLIATGSAKQMIKIFNLQGEQLGTIKYHPTFMAQKIGSVSCLQFHPYEALLAAGAADPCVSLYTDEVSP